MIISKVVRKPIVTEKTNIQASNSKFAFEVDLRASKGAIASTIKDLFEVDVLNVKTTIMPGKKKRILGTRKYTKTNKWKKAIVTLKEGQTISLFTVNS